MNQRLTEQPAAEPQEIQKKEWVKPQLGIISIGNNVATLSDGSGSSAPS